MQFKRIKIDIDLKSNLTEMWIPKTIKIIGMVKIKSRKYENLKKSNWHLKCNVTFPYLKVC